MIMPGRSAFNLLILFNLIALTTTGCDSGSKSYSGESPASQNEPGLMEPTPSPGPTPEDNQTPPSLSPNIASFDGTIPLTVTFYANASDKGDIEVYEWDFDGDGNVDITTETDGVDFEFTKPGNL